MQAPEQVRITNERALESNVIGGVRTGINVLKGQSALFLTRRDLSQAHYYYLIGRLRLKAAAGKLEKQDPGQINQRLAHKTSG